MLKKGLSVLLVLCIFCGCMLPAAGAGKIGTIRLKLNSDIDGLTERHYEKVIEIKSDNVVYTKRSAGPVSFSDYAGTPVQGAVKAGREYTVHYLLDAAEGYALPDDPDELDVEIECGKGVKVISKQIVSARERDESGNFVVTYRGLMIYASIVVDGSVFQRMIGRIHDIIIKIRAWSLY